MPNLIPDPADRLTPDFLQALHQRYAGSVPPDPVDDYPARFTNAADAVVQLLWPDKYGTAPDDEHQHTSDPARQIAHAVLHAAGITPR